MYNKSICKSFTTFALVELKIVWTYYLVILDYYCTVKKWGNID